MYTMDRSTKLGRLSDSAKDRKQSRGRYFIGGSDARIIMGNDEQALIRLWREKRGEVEPEASPAISWFSSDLPPRSSTAAGTRPIPGRWSPTSRRECVTRRCAGWRPLWMDGLTAAMRCSRPSSCCRGRSRKKRRPRNTCRSCNIICGWWRHGPRCCQSSPGEGSRSRSSLMPIRSIST